MRDGILGLDLCNIRDVEIGEPDGMVFGVRDLFAELLGAEEGEFFELFDWFGLIHRINDDLSYKIDIKSYEVLRENRGASRTIRQPKKIIRS